MASTMSGLVAGNNFYQTTFARTDFCKIGGSYAIDDCTYKHVIYLSIIKISKEISRKLGRKWICQSQGLFRLPWSVINHIDLSLLHRAIFILCQCHVLANSRFSK